MNINTNTHEMVIYKTTNTVTGKAYVGMHASTKGFQKSGYYGSSKQLRSDIKHYGKDRFTREIIATASTIAELRQLERHYVDYTWCARRDTYNINIGGIGCFMYGQTKEVLVDDVTYSSVTAAKQAMKSSGAAWNRLIDEGRVTYINDDKRENNNGAKISRGQSISVIVDGVEYPTVTTAKRMLSLSYYKWNEMHDEGRILYPQNKLKTTRGQN